MAINDVYEVILKGFSSESNTINVFNYRQEVADAGDDFALELASGFDNQILLEICKIQQGSQAYHTIEVFNYGDAGDYAILVGADIVNDAGTYGSVPGLPAGVTAGFSYRRAAFGIRSGSKRFSSIPEEGVGNYNVSSAYAAILDTLATKLELDIVQGGNTYNPVVVYGPRILGINPTNYRPLAVGFSRIGSQNSRKVDTIITA